MREIRQSGSEGGGELPLSPYPYLSRGYFSSGAFSHKPVPTSQRIMMRMPNPTNAGQVGCGPAVGVAITLYWTGALEGQAQPGWNCATADWTCEGGSTIGIASYAASLATTATASPMGGHTPYANPPELTRF